MQQRSYRGTGGNERTRHLGPVQERQRRHPVADAPRPCEAWSRSPAGRATPSGLRRRQRADQTSCWLDRPRRTIHCAAISLPPVREPPPARSRLCPLRPPFRIVNQLRGQEGDVARATAHIEHAHPRTYAAFAHEAQCDRINEARLHPEALKLTIGMPQDVRSDSYQRRCSWTHLRVWLRGPSKECATTDDRKQDGGARPIRSEC